MAKQHLVASAERLTSAYDYPDAKNEIRALQAEWKTIGHAGDAEERMWTRFRAACDEVYAKAAGQREIRQREFREWMEAQIANLEQKIDKAEAAKDRTESFIESQRYALQNLRPGGGQVRSPTTLGFRIGDATERVIDIQRSIDRMRGWLEEARDKWRSAF